MDRYRTCWESNDPDAIADLFTDGALYYDSPSLEPWSGKDRIVAEWLARKDEPGDATFTYEVLSATGDVAFVRGVSDYQKVETIYDNLWEVTLDDAGQLHSFVEWWVERPKN